jgi:hypothetical protein
MSTASSKHFISIGIGGFFYCLINGCRGKLVQQYEQRKEKRNLLTGYLISIILLMAMLYWCLLK